MMSVHSTDLLNHCKARWEEEEEEEEEEEAVVVEEDL